MQNVVFPATAKIGPHSLDVTAHTRGGAGKGGHFAFARAPGAMFKGQLEILPALTADAVEFRAFLHSLRGKGGTFLLAIPGKVQATRPTFFTDQTEFTDGTTFSDVYAFVDYGTLTAPVVRDADVLPVNVDFATYSAEVGDYCVIGDITTTGQLLRVTGVDGTDLTVRPRLRRAYPSGTVVSSGRVVGKFRLDQDTPAVPLIGDRSLSLSLEIAEAY